MKNNKRYDRIYDVVLRFRGSDVGITNHGYFFATYRVCHGYRLPEYCRRCCCQLSWQSGLLPVFCARAVHGWENGLLWVCAFGFGDILSVYLSLYIYIITKTVANYSATNDTEYRYFV